MKTGSTTKKVIISLTIVAIMLAAIMSPAYAEPSAKSQGKGNQAGSVTGEVALATQNQEMATVSAQGVPSLEVRYALVESKVSLMIGVMNALIPVIPEAYAAEINELSMLITKLNDDLTALNTYVVANDSAGFNAYIKETLHPDMMNASKAIKSDTQQFKDWGVTKDQVKQLKNNAKELRDEYNVGAHVSAVAKAKNARNEETQAYLNKAGIKAQVQASEEVGKPDKTQGQTNSNKNNGKSAAGDT